MTLKDQDYFEMPSLNVLVYHNTFPEGHQSGVEVIQHGERMATIGTLEIISQDFQDLFILSIL